MCIVARVEGFVKHYFQGSKQMQCKRGGGRFGEFGFFRLAWRLDSRGGVGA